MKSESMLRKKVKELEKKMVVEGGITNIEMDIYKTIKWVLREGPLPKNKIEWKQ